MSTFRVWAPKASAVDVEIHGRRSLLSTGEGGWWETDTPEAAPGVEYAFVIDGGQPLPDPRSAFQPHGVHGPSRNVDHSSFPWTDGGWRAGPLSSAVIYELHVGTFTPAGTFDSAIARLDHLVDLGVTHVELMPVAAFPGQRGWGYDGVALYAPHAAYGGPDGLKRLVDACHGRGLAVVLDVVYNHLGPSGNYLGHFGPYFSERYTTPWGKAVNFDGPDSDEVRRFFCDNAMMWLRDYHIDGLRLDAVHAIIDTSAVHFLEQLASEVDDLETRLGRHLVLIAESDLNDPRLVRSSEVGGYGLDAQWSDDFHHALRVALTGERTGYYEDFSGLPDLATALTRGFVYTGQTSIHRRRRHGRPATGVRGHRFVGYVENHDQVGNRCAGDRLAHAAGPARFKIAVALLMTSPFVPMIFQGGEWAASSPFQYFTDHEDAELGRAVCEGRRTEFAAFGWKADEVPDPQAVETFARSKLDWSELSREPHVSVLEWHERLIRLRRQFPALSTGRLDHTHVRFDEESRWVVVERGPIATVCNLADRPFLVPLGDGADRTVLLASEPGVKTMREGVELPPESVAIVLRD